MLGTLLSSPQVSVVCIQLGDYFLYGFMSFGLASVNMNNETPNLLFFGCELVVMAVGI